MLDRIHGFIIFECDGNKCHEVLETETRDFDEARDILADADWETRRVGGEWMHICADCKASEMESIL